MAAGRTTIIIDSDYDNDVIEILDSDPFSETSLPAKDNNIERASKNTTRASASRPTTKPTTPKIPSKKEQKPTGKSSTLIPKQPLKATTKVPRQNCLPTRPTSSPKSQPPPSPSNTSTQNSPQRPAPTPNAYKSLNPTPKPVVSHSPSKKLDDLLPLNRINKLFQRDSRTVTLDKANRRLSALHKSPSSFDISKKLEMDSELAAIFASTPESSASAPLLSDKTPSQKSPPDKKSTLISSSPTRESNFPSNQQGLHRASSFLSPNSLNFPPAPSRKRPISSLQSTSPFNRPVFNKKQIIYGIEDEDGEDEDLELYINQVSSRRKLFSDEIMEAERRKMGNKQCPLCYMMFPKQQILEHSSECDGKPSENGLKKRTIGTAVALNAAERKKKNAGLQDTGSTNYYADSEGALALGGTGFGSEATAQSWESAGQIRFS